MAVDYLSCGDKTLDLRTPQLMGVLNITPDSFSDSGELYRSRVIQWRVLMSRAEEMVGSGVAMLDIGGESTRPQADAVSEQEECDRVLPVVEKVRAEFPVIVSVDTSNAAVMRQAAALGAGFINDVRALRAPGALKAAAATGLPVCLMHIGGSGDPKTMQDGIDYQNWQKRDIVAEINHFLDARIVAACAAGIARTSLVLDPGFGFGKRDVDNLQIVNELDRVGHKDDVILIGVSRKSTLGRLLGRKKPTDRVAGGLALVACALQKGARIIRTHDVTATADVCRVIERLRQV